MACPFARPGGPVARTPSLPVLVDKITACPHNLLGCATAAAVEPAASVRLHLDPAASKRLGTHVYELFDSHCFTTSAGSTWLPALRTAISASVNAVR